MNYSNDKEPVLIPRTQSQHIPIKKTLYIESCGHYVYFYINNGSCISVVKIRARLDEIEHELGDKFLRVHQRYIVNLKYVVDVKPSGINIRVNKSSSISIPIARSRKRQVLEDFYNKCSVE